MILPALDNKMNIPKKFISLHAHDTFSIGDAIGYPKDHIDFVIKNGMDAHAITNHGNMSNFANFYFAAKEKQKTEKFKPIFGVEAYYHPDLKQWQSEYEKSKETTKEAEDDNSVKENEEESKNLKVFNPINRRHHMVLLAKNQRGLKKLFHLVSRSFQEGFYRFPRIDASMLKDAGGDIICSSACISSYLGYSIFNEFKDKPREELSASLLDDPIILQKILNNLEQEIAPIVSYLGKENVFLELQFNKLNPQHLLNRALIEFSKKTNLKLIATTDAHYYSNDVWQSRELYKLISRLTQGNVNSGMLPQNIEDLKCELYPKNAQQMWDGYKRYGEGQSFYDDELIKDAIERTHDIAFNLIEDVEPDKSIKLPSSFLPQGDHFNILVDKCKEGLKGKNLHTNQKYVQRLKDELRIIKDKGFSQYFLTMKVIADIAQSEMIWGPGRGSSAGSLINYTLGITNVDPLKYDLLFARFINPSRADYPDIDIDVSERDTLVNSLKDKLGRDKIIPISNYNTLQIKSLVKDISKLYEIPFQDVNEVTFGMDDEILDKICEVGDNRAEKKANITYDDAIKHSKKFREFIERYPYIGEHIAVLHKQIRTTSTHAAGVVIADNPAEEMPLIAVKKELQTPFTEGQTVKHLGPLGWVKFDLLGIETLKCIEECVKQILRNKFHIQDPPFAEVKKWVDEYLDPDKLDLEDEKVYKNVYWNKRFVNTFQFDQPHAQNFVSALNPINIEDIAVATSICRPGPLSSGVDKDYIKAKDNPEDIRYEHPLVEKVLSKTFGFVIFQEQASLLGKYVAGMSDADCERIRKVTTKVTSSGVDKTKKEADELEIMFVEGAVKNGIDRSAAEELFDRIRKFVSYSFNKSLEEGTKISTYDSKNRFIKNRNIKDIIPGDKVKSFDNKLKKECFVEVKNLYNHDILDCYEVEFDDGRKVTCTLNHKFKTQEEGMQPVWRIFEKGLNLI
jgi:DNA polymerase-3 subunit alpha